MFNQPNNYQSFSLNFIRLFKMLLLFGGVLTSCSSSPQYIHIKNDWYIHDNVEVDFLLEYRNYDVKKKLKPEIRKNLKPIGVHEYCVPSDSILITKYNSNIGPRTIYHIVNLYSLEIKEFVYKHLKNDSLVLVKFKGYEFKKPK